MKQFLLQALNLYELRKYYSIIRCFLSAILVYSTLRYFQNADFSSAVLVSLVAAAWSVAMQYWNEQYLGWLSSDQWFSYSSVSKAPLWMSFWKKMFSSAIYAVLLQLVSWKVGLSLGLTLLLAVHRVITTVTESLFTQTSWQRLNHEWTTAAIRRCPHYAICHQNLSGLGSLVQSAIAVTANTFNLSGSIIGSYLSLSMGTAGLVILLFRTHFKNALVG